MSIGVIIQARMGSTRLPGKVLKSIAGKALLDHVLGRLSLLKYSARVIVATSNLPEDTAIVQHCLKKRIDLFRGSELDVLDRYYRCACHYSCNHVVRLTADNPFTDIEELQRLIEQHLSEGNDYTHSFGFMPLGVGAEVFTFEALEISAQEGHAANHREHVNEYIQENPNKFRIGSLEVSEAKKQPRLRLTVDTQEDYLRVCSIVEHSPNHWIGTEEAISICLQSA
ncbi:MAG: acylneuraminate cytidylyltransferase [Endozoicomonadaceae bacterium]|nr:acylneuraminate cytidylyltransferase [Endozoicomonadaceae bacterium]